MRLASGLPNTPLYLGAFPVLGAALAAGVPPRETVRKPHWQHTCARPGLPDSGRRGIGLHRRNQFRN